MVCPFRRRQFHSELNKTNTTNESYWSTSYLWKKKVFPIVLIDLFMVCSAGIVNLPGEVWLGCEFMLRWLVRNYSTESDVLGK